MMNLKRNIVLAAGVAVVSVLPFVILDYVNTKGFARAGFPVSLFAFLWLLSFAFVMMLTPIVRDLRVGTSVRAHPARLILQTALMVAVAAIWVSLVNDQMPCFMGVSNCD
jgi:hypothetical protein